MALFAGTSGFSYQPWNGPFYPEDLPAKKMLSYYASKLPAVEINSTYYRMPKSSTLADWRQQVPNQFRFAVKANRRITQTKKLVGCEEELRYLLAALEKLEDRLGAVLFQLPPNVVVEVERLLNFLQLLPTDLRAAFEFRHESWSTDEVDRVLLQFNAARVVTDVAGGDAQPLPTTADWCYLRLRARNYAATSLRSWASAMQSYAQSCVFLKHEDNAIGPRLAQQLTELWSGA